MGKGVLYKSNGNAWSKSFAKKFNGSSMSDGKVRHADNSNWYDNYPMEQLYEQYFNVAWTQAYNASGVKLDPATWGDHPRAGDSIGFIGLWGYDNNAIKNFVGNGVIQAMKIEVMFDDPSHAGNPRVFFGPHNYKSKPASVSWANMNQSINSGVKQFNQTQSDYTATIDLSTATYLNGDMGGVTVWAETNTAANSCRFAGATTSHSLNSFNSRLWIRVLK